MKNKTETIYYESESISGLVLSIDFPFEVELTFNQWLNHLRLKKRRNCYTTFNLFSKPELRCPDKDGILRFVCGSE